MFCLHLPAPYLSPLISAPLLILSDWSEHPLVQFPLFLYLLFRSCLGFFSFWSDLCQDGSGNLLAHKTHLPNHCLIFPLPLFGVFIVVVVLGVFVVCVVFAASLCTARIG